LSKENPYKGEKKEEAEHEHCGPFSRNGEKGLRIFLLSKNIGGRERVAREGEPAWRGDE